MLHDSENIKSFPSFTTVLSVDFAKNQTLLNTRNVLKQIWKTDLNINMVKTSTDLIKIVS